MTVYSITYIIGMIIIAGILAFFVYRDSKNKKRALTAFVLTLAALSLIDYIKDK